MGSSVKTAQDYRICRTQDILNPNAYIKGLAEDYADVAYTEARAPQYRGNWRSQAFQMSNETPLDLEIGTGNGYFFAHRASQHPERLLVGLEIKFKPLIQTVKRTQKTGASNFRLARFHASVIQELFAPQELNHVFIYFPDPWPKRRSQKNRLIQAEFLKNLFELQKPGSFVEFKTDDRDYFEWTREVFRGSSYRVDRETWDLHSEPWASENFQTHFEKLWTSKGLKTHQLRAWRD